MPPPIGDASIDQRFPEDLLVTSDILPGPECQNVRECAPMPPPGSVRACPTSNWSCIAGRCTYECDGGRSCYVDIKGCLNCDGKEIQCPGMMCERPPLAQARMEDATCARAFLLDVDSCFGSFVQLKDGLICSLQTLPTGAIRKVLACGRCQTQIVF